MTEEQAQKDVRTVENLRRQNAIWRTGSTDCDYRNSGNRVVRISSLWDKV